MLVSTKSHAIATRISGSILLQELQTIAQKWIFDKREPTEQTQACEWTANQSNSKRLAPAHTGMYDLRSGHSLCTQAPTHRLPSGEVWTGLECC